MLGCNVDDCECVRARACAPLKRTHEHGHGQKLGEGGSPQIWAEVSSRVCETMMQAHRAGSCNPASPCRVSSWQVRAPQQKTEKKARTLGNHCFLSPLMPRSSSTTGSCESSPTAAAGMVAIRVKGCVVRVCDRNRAQEPTGRRWQSALVGVVRGARAT